MGAIRCRPLEVFPSLATVACLAHPAIRPCIADVKRRQNIKGPNGAWKTPLARFIWGRACKHPHDNCNQEKEARRGEKRHAVVLVVWMNEGNFVKKMPRKTGVGEPTSTNFAP